MNIQNRCMHIQYCFYIMGVLGCHIASAEGFAKPFAQPFDGARLSLRVTSTKGFAKHFTKGFTIESFG